MKISALTTLSLITSTAAFSVSSNAASTTTSSTQLQSSSSNDDVSTSMSRRNILSIAFSASAMAIGSSSANASLLDDYGADPKKIDNSGMKRKEEEAEEARRKLAAAQPKADSNIEPNLRSNYYYPTNKKRYLPRIKKCNDAIPDAANAIGEGDWETASDFVNKVADDTILPLKLYTSSLTGGGTNVKVTFTKDMFEAADQFEKAQKALVKAVKKKDQTASSRALEELSTALQSYRTVAKLTGPDAGGDIPSVDEIRRSACRVQGRTFELKVKDRDARLKAAGEPVVAQ